MSSSIPIRALQRAQCARLAPHLLSNPSLAKRSFSLCKQFRANRRLQAKLRQYQSPTVQQVRKASTFRTKVSQAWRKYPLMMSFASLLLTALVVWNSYNIYDSKIHAIDDLNAFPEPVAKYVRRALYYANYSPNPKKALQNYQKAILVAEDIGMDPFSAEILGLKIQAAAYLEKLGLYQKAIDVLEEVRADTLKWNEMFGDRPENAEKRTRLLVKAIQMSYKLGEYYMHPTISLPGEAESKMAWAVTAILKENERRQKAGIKAEYSDGWLGADETGAALEGLADHYASTSQNHLAVPLFLQALSLSPQDSCHTVIMMSNLALALAFQHPPSVPNQPPPLAANQIFSAKTWATKALKLAASITPPARSEECDIGCAVATINLGDFAEMEGNIEKAQQYWKEGESLSQAIKFEEGKSVASRKLKEGRSSPLKT